MNPRLALVAAAGVLALLLVAVLLMPSPDTGGPLVPAPAPAPIVAPVPPRIVGLPSVPPRPEVADTGEEEPAHPEAVEPVRAPAPFQPAPLDKVYVAEAKGLGEALLARRDRLRDCWGAFLGRASIGAEEAGRFTIELSVAQGEEPDAAVVSGASDPELEACVADAVADARFEAPEVGRVSVLWPVPIAVLPGEPR